MEKEFLTVYYLKYISENQNKFMCLKNVIPAQYEEQLEKFIKKINRMPQEIEIINWLVENKLYKEVFKLLIPKDDKELLVAENTISNNSDVASIKESHGEIVDFYVNFRNDKEKYSLYKEYLGSLYRSHTNDTISISEYKKFTLIDNILSKINIKKITDDNSFLKNEDVIKIVNYISEKNNIYVSRLPISKHKGYTLSVEPKGFSSVDKFIEIIEKDGDDDFLIYNFIIDESFTTIAPNIFFLNMTQKKFEIKNKTELLFDQIIKEDEIEQSVDVSVVEITSIETPEKTQARRILNYYKKNMFELKTGVNSSTYLYHPEKGIYFEFNNDNDMLLVRDNVWSEISQWTKEYYETEQLIKEIIEEEKWFNVAFELKPACLKRENGYWKDIEYNFIFKYETPEKITEEYLKNKTEMWSVVEKIGLSNQERVKEYNNKLPDFILNAFRNKPETENTTLPVSENELPEYKINVEIDFKHMSDYEKLEFDVQMKQIQNIFAVKNLDYKIIKQ